SLVRSEDRLYLLSASGGNWPMPHLPAQQQYWQFPVLACVNTADGAVQWKHQMEQGQFANGPRSLPPQRTPSQVLVSTRDQQTAGTKLNLFTREGGKVLVNNQ